METILSQKLARQRLLQSQKRALLDEYMPIKEELETLEDEIEQLEEELQKQEDVQADTRFDELIEGLDKEIEAGVEPDENIKLDGVKTIEENEAEEIESLEPQRQPKAWSHADEETDNDR